MSQPLLSACAPLPSVEVRRSDIHGLGVFALVALPKGSTVGFYDGKRYSARQIAKVEWNEKLTYLFGLSNGSTIDGGQGGNATRHLNHACEPNCEAVEEEAARGKLLVRIVTLKRVKAGEELFIDYCLTADASALPDDYACYCGAKTCRGTMLGSTQEA